MRIVTVCYRLVRLVARRALPRHVPVARHFKLVVPGVRADDLASPAPSAPRLGNQRPWYVQPRLCDWAYKRSRATYRKEKGIVSRWSVSS